MKGIESTVDTLQTSSTGSSKVSSHITTLFLDVGGVMLTNGWGRGSRKKAAEKYGLDFADIDERHHLTFDIYEEGKLSLDDYLDSIIFYKEQSFTREEFKEFMFAQSVPLQPTMDLLRALKYRYRLHTIVVSNEGRELTEYRVKKFNMTEWLDAFIVSSFVHLRKPDPDIYHLALDIAQVPQDEILYIDDRAMFVGAAQRLGFRSLQHTSYETTRDALTALGLTLDNPAMTEQTE